jgi:DNA-binding MarR family transcriptional regulator
MRGHALARGLLKSGSGRPRMNAHFFSTKRAHYGVLRVLRKPLKAFGLTAARYDLLHVIFGDRREPAFARTVSQSDIRRRLGVCKSVVSRMLKSLEKLGLVERQRFYQDTRQRWVSLTKLGQECMREAVHCLERAARRLLCIAICFGKDRDEESCFEHMCNLEMYLHGMRRHYGDTAALLYPWHPDD